MKLAPSRNRSQTSYAATCSRLGGHDPKTSGVNRELLAEVRRSCNLRRGWHHHAEGHRQVTRLPAVALGDMIPGPSLTWRPLHEDAHEHCALLTQWSLDVEPEGHSFLTSVNCAKTSPSGAWPRRRSEQPGSTRLRIRARAARLVRR